MLISFQTIGDENKILARSLAHISEVHRRNLFLTLGFQSLYEFCLTTLPLSPGSVYRRTQVAKRAQRHPLLLELIARGELNLTAASKICPHLKDCDQDVFIKSFIGKTVSEVIATLANEQDIQESPDLILRTKDKTIFEDPTNNDLKLTQARNEDPVASPPPIEKSDPQPDSIGSKPPVIKREKRYAIRFSASEQLKNKLERAKEVMSNKYPNGKFEEIFEAALDELLKKNAPELKKACNSSKRTNPKSSYIPKKMENEVFAKANNRCEKVSADGRRCSSKKYLHTDHIISRALGGLTVLENLQVLCQPHNLQKARDDLGSDFVARKIRKARTSAELRRTFK